MTPAPIRCAIYTRKSSEEGLEQSFNSLDAQREACEAYIKSQRHEGWTILPQTYDDGGFSGGTLERPAVKRLLEDVDMGRVDTIVVYKVDRLTRSLADFAKIVEKLDQQKVSFVSVTQQFNTTTSMGRLTLNVLLSFAQFEREVTGERIRDKIAASKRKGMWMGGVVPLGYDLRDRHLVANPAEAEQVKQIFEAYLEQGCVSNLQVHLDRIGLMSKRRVSKAGNATGGNSFSRGALYLLLQNRIYLGEITHKDASYPGQHEAIIDQVLWDEVQKQLKSNLQSEGRSSGSRPARFLMGKLFDADGAVFTPTHTNKRGRLYHYYVSKITAKSRSKRAAGKMRIPADRIEHLVFEETRRGLCSPQRLLEALEQSDGGYPLQHLVIKLAASAPTDISTIYEVITRVVVHPDQVEVQVPLVRILRRLRDPAPLDQRAGGMLRIHIPLTTEPKNADLRLVMPAARHGSQGDNALVRGIARAHAWLERILSGEIPNARALAKESGYNERYVSRILPLAFLAPDVIERALEPTGDSPLSDFPGNIPALWAAQRAGLE